MAHMPTTMHEFAGTILSVDSDPATTDSPLPTLTSVRVLGADYKPCGPNLVEFLDRMVMPTKLDRHGNVTELAPFLSLVTKEIYDQRINPPAANQ